MQDIVTYKGSLYFKEGAEAKPKELPGSLIAFTRNGELQGTAFRCALLLSAEMLLGRSLLWYLCSPDWHFQELQFGLSLLLQVEAIDSARDCCCCAPT